MKHELVIVLDFGGQYNQLIARRVRECNVYCEVKPYTTPLEELKAMHPIGFIFTGGPNSVYDAKAPHYDPAIFQLGVPILGICYGCQLMAHTLGGKVTAAQADSAREYGKTETFYETACKLFKGLPAQGISWMSHSDYMAQVPDGFQLMAHSDACPNVAIGLSGGVDSSVAAALLAEAVGNQLTCVFVDHGLMRKNEGDEVEAAFAKWDLNFVRVDAEERFLTKLAGVSDPEKKHKIIGEEFIRVFEEEAKKLGTVDYLVQGTIYPDVIESGAGDADVIKSHHNVGGLPKNVDFKDIIEPLRMLFKDEVRQLGRELGLPEYLVMRQPFPGPGLAVRILGAITKEKADILRDADAIFREEVAKAGWDSKISQYFAVLTDMRSVGVMGDGRTYDYTVALRGVTTSDFMTADWARIPYEVLDKTSVRIVNEVRSINRIVYDITSKPPGTIEWE